MQAYPKEVRFRDGTTVVLRPMPEDDLDRSHRLFRKLPEEDRRVFEPEGTLADFGKDVMGNQHDLLNLALSI